METLNNKRKIIRLLLKPNILRMLRLPPACSLLLFLTILLNGQSWSATTPTEEPAESLLSLPYIQYVKEEKAPNKVGTTIYKKNKTFHGYNIYVRQDNMNFFVNLIDMDGTLVHQWAGNPRGVLSKWYQVTPFPNGDIFLSNHWGTPDWQWVDINSHAFATYDMPNQIAHHAHDCLKNGGFLGLVANTISIPSQNTTIKIINNSLVHISPNGKALKTISLNTLFKKNPAYQQKTEEFLTKHPQNATKKPLFNPFHINNIDNLEWNIPGIAKKGDWLITSKQMNKILILDPEKEKIVWQWGGGIISAPHHATFLKGNQILLFDNGVNKKSSRVIVLDMKSKKIVWQYGQKPGQEFFTAAGGSVQRLPNGNTLIAEGGQGRVFEVTLTGEIVWEWYADYYTKGKLQGKRRTIYRMQRVPYDFFNNVTFNHGKTPIKKRD